jgi:hypothetical protein
MAGPLEVFEVAQGIWSNWPSFSWQSAGLGVTVDLHRRTDVDTRP